MYHALLVLGLCLFYVLLCYGLAWFFEGSGPIRPSWRSAALVALLAIVGDAASTMVGDWQLANRVLHVFGGGLPAYAACIFAARDAGIAPGRARLAIAAALLVTAMGVANEHVELVLQRYAHLRFAAGPLDTWLDLASNTAGVILAGFLFWPFMQKAPLTRESREFSGSS